MSIKYKYIRWIVCASVLLLSACTTQTTQQSTSSSSQTVSATSRNVSDDYRVVFVNNAYPISKSRGITSSLLSSTNISSFEKGLLEISKSHFPVNNYYFLEGQFVESSLITEWLSVQSDAKPKGLNTTVPGQKDIIVSILEQDYMVKVDNNYELNGLSIGIALNPNISTSVTLSDNDLMTIGKNASTKILEELRKKEGMGNIPILFGLYKQSEDKGVSRGTYLLSGVSRSGTTVSNWEQTKWVQRVFPLDTDKMTEARQFEEFKKNVEAFFPNLNGVVGQATFNDNVLTELDITITTQFYSQSEMIGLTQFIVEQAARYNRQGLRVTIKVESVRGSEAVVYKGINETEFHSVILK